jgi:Domain of unknown function (DUF5615)
MSMPLPIYMDVHIPVAITDGLRRRGLDVITRQEDGTDRADDDALLTRATELGRLLYSQDQDFLQIAAAWQQAGRAFRGILFAHQQGASLGRTIDDLELILNCCLPDELCDRVIYLPLR